MLIADALNLLELTGKVGEKEIKNAYRKACSKYHPDKNNCGHEMMQAINEAYETLKGFDGEVKENFNNYADELNNALNSIVSLVGVDVEVCGNWVWLTGETKQHKEIIKKAGFKWASKKKSWYFKPSDWVKKSRGSMDMDAIRKTHGSESVKKKYNKTIAA